MDRLERSDTEKMLFGVCGGLATNLDVDPLLFRILFVIVGFFSGGTAVIGYLLLAILMPPPSVTTDDSDDGEHAGEAGESQTRSQTSENLEQLRAEAYEAGKRFKAVLSNDSPSGKRTNSNRMIWGIIGVVLGGLLLAGNLGIFFWLPLGEYWPVLVIGAGVVLIAMSRRNGPSDR